VSVIFGKAGGFSTIHLGQLSYNQGFLVYGGQDGGFDMSAAGDVNGDGFDDFIVGAPGADDGGIDAGNAYVIYGREDPDWVSLRDLGPDEGFMIQGDQGGDMAGRSVAGGGDVNGDGFADIILGAPYGDDGGVSAGEAYVIFGAAPTAGVTRIGSAIGQTIRGGIGDDRLDGRDGDDVLLAGGGDDELIGAAGNDDVNGGDGDDTLSGGSGNDTLTGGNGIDSLTGGSGTDLLDAGLGGDFMNGGSGNDVYRVDSVADRVVEADGAGVDRIFSRVSYTLAEGVYVETLNTLSNTGTTLINLTGNSFANKIAGNAGANTLSGAGGADSLNGLAGNDRIYGGGGNDVLGGAGGADRFFFDTRLSAAANGDRIADFLVADDTIMLDRAVFGGIGADGVLAAPAFALGTAAADASDRIIYDGDTGRIFYDADGAGGAAQTLFARVDPLTALTRADFIAYQGGAEAAAAKQPAFASAEDTMRILFEPSRVSAAGEWADFAIV
jgi:Ca2+-binding RTX toxin-like protein